MAIGTPVNLGTAQNGANGTSQVITTGADAPAGNAIIVACVLNATATGISCTDSASNVYTGTTVYTFNTIDRIVVFYCANPVLLSSGGTITVSMSSSRIACSAISVSGLDLSSPLDVTGAGVTGSGTSASIGTGALASSSEIVLGVLSAINSVTAPSVGAGFTALNNPGTAGVVNLIFGYQTVSANTGVTFAPSWTTSRVYGANVYTFKAASGTAAPFVNPPDALPLVAARTHVGFALSSNLPLTSAPVVPTPFLGVPRPNPHAAIPAGRDVGFTVSASLALTAAPVALPFMGTTAPTPDYRPYTARLVGFTTAAYLTLQPSAVPFKGTAAPLPLTLTRLNPGFAQSARLALTTGAGVPFKGRAAPLPPTATARLYGFVTGFAGLFPVPVPPVVTGTVGKSASVTLTFAGMSATPTGEVDLLVDSSSTLLVDTGGDQLIVSSGAGLTFTGKTSSSEV